MGAGTLEEPPLGSHYKRKLVVSVRLDLANLSDEVNYRAPTQIARQFAADEAVKKVFMAFTNMIIHPKRVSPDKDKCCSSLLIHPDARQGMVPLNFLARCTWISQIVCDGKAK